MKLAKLAVAAVAPLAVLAANPALANEQVVVGATVSGPEGNAVGTIVTVENGQAILDTGKHKVPLGIDMYGEGETGPTITVTKAQLDSMMDAQIAEAEAKLDAALVVGAEAMDAEHAPLGTILEIDGDNIVIARGGDEMDKVTLLREHFAVGDHGLMALLTNAQIEAAMAQTAPAGGGASAGE